MATLCRSERPTLTPNRQRRRCSRYANPAPPKQITSMLMTPSLCPPPPDSRVGQRAAISPRGGGGVLAALGRTAGQTGVCDGPPHLSLGSDCESSIKIQSIHPAFLSLSFSFSLSISFFLTGHFFSFPQSFPLSPSHFLSHSLFLSLNPLQLHTKAVLSPGRSELANGAHV